ncbi:Ribosomal-protein-S18-alanine acetyltransferase [Granulibacter bethesdensis]|uniref:ribosomal protein S18-alanine N-acetyltransferase n=1 Tax=Granulibacter bethesdensis TaxID=364410 RepID=UPI00090C6420|nr:ribosomal protein S18-alanine N-acetyltransferase [Granulibacter bethesdensis]APH56183.1 Ribosomal-protein-S18-alanine acetyltransferase [Granulibacter bethesdensis]
MTAPLPDDHDAVIVVGPGHAAVLAVLHEAAFPPEEQWDEASFIVQLQQPGTVALMAVAGEHATEPVGFVLFRTIFEACEILTLAVAPYCRRQGIGDLLMRTAMKRAADQGAEHMLLEVETTNLPARTLYDRLGFSAIGLRRHYYHGGGDALVLRRSLGRSLDSTKITGGE